MATKQARCAVAASLLKGTELFLDNYVYSSGKTFTSSG